MLKGILSITGVLPAFLRGYLLVVIFSVAGVVFLIVTSLEYEPVYVQALLVVSRVTSLAVADTMSLY